MIFSCLQVWIVFLQLRLLMCTNNCLSIQIDITFIYLYYEWNSLGVLMFECLLIIRSCQNVKRFAHALGFSILISRKCNRGRKLNKLHSFEVITRKLSFKKNIFGHCPSLLYKFLAINIMRNPKLKFIHLNATQ